MRPVAAIAIVAAATACTTSPRPPPTADDTTPRAAAARFLEAVEAERWDDAYALLSARWRETLTPERLAADRRQGGALAKDRLDRARIALRGEPLISGQEALFDNALRLVREADGWRVDGL